MSKTYLSTDQLAARLPYSPRTIREQLKDSVFLEGVHYIRPFAHADAGLSRAKGGPVAGKLLDDATLADVFGVEMAELAPAIVPAKRRSRSGQTLAAGLPAKPAKAARAKQPAVNASANAGKRPPGVAKAKPPAKTPSKAREPTVGATATKAEAGGKARAPKPPPRGRPRHDARWPYRERFPRAECGWRPG